MAPPVPVQVQARGEPAAHNSEAETFFRACSLVTVIRRFAGVTLLLPFASRRERELVEREGPASGGVGDRDGRRADPCEPGELPARLHRECTVAAADLADRDRAVAPSDRRHIRGERQGGAGIVERRHDRRELRGGIAQDEIPSEGGDWRGRDLHRSRDNDRDPEPRIGHGHDGRECAGLRIRVDADHGKESTTRPSSASSVGIDRRTAARLAPGRARVDRDVAALRYRIIRAL